MALDGTRQVLDEQAIHQEILIYTFEFILSPSSNHGFATPL